MNRKTFLVLLVIVLLTAAAIWIDLPNNPGILNRDIRVVQGLDLQGGIQVLLEADLPDGARAEAEAMETARKIIENRVNSLGISEPLVQRQGAQRIIIELPGIENEEQALELIRETGLLEFIDAGYEFLQAGTPVQTDYIPGLPLAETPATDQYDELGQRIYHTVMTGEALKNAAATVNPDAPTGASRYLVGFELQPNWASFFSQYTAANQGKFLAIVLDKEVISCPQIQDRIPDGNGVISGNFELEEAHMLAIQLRYGALPVPLRIESNQKIGPSLGQESIQQSVKAGIVGLSAVLIFMLIYYRLPGLLADLSLIIYGLLNFAVFKMGSAFMIALAFALLIIYLIERKDTWQLWMFVGLLMAALVLNFKAVTLTLPGIAGFLLSTGMAVDANILIFERIKEELRAGRSLQASLNAGFDRAWTSIWDSQASTLIICAILYIFGSNFGAGIVKGFAITLAIGTVINLFTAITVTRTFMSAVLEPAQKSIEKRRWLLGI